MIYEVVYCADCKKPLKSVPSWLAGVNVRFSCDSCRQRHPRTPVGYDAPAAVREFGGDDPVVVADPIEVVEDEPIEDEVDVEDSPVISVED